MRRITVLLFATIILSSVTTLAQTKRPTTRTPSRTTATQKAAEAKRAGATRVGDQVKNLTRFLYLLGGVAKGLEQSDEAIRRNDASPAVIEQTQRSKASVRTSLQSVREGLDKLELDFRTTPELERYYIKLAGVAAGAVTAEEQAARGQFDAAGRSLLGVVSRLTDVLLLMGTT